MERNGASYMAEPEIMGNEAAWEVGRDRILAVQTCEDGYDYTLLDENYNEVDGGQVDNPELSMIEVRQDILESFGLERRELRAMFYEDVMEQMFENGRLAVDAPEKREEMCIRDRCNQSLWQRLECWTIDRKRFDGRMRYYSQKFCQAGRFDFLPRHL